MSEVLLEAKNVKKYFPIRKGLLLRHVGDVKAVDGVSFVLKRGQTLGLVGESGCGKSTLGRTLIRLYEATEGEIVFRGRDFNALNGVELREERKNVQMIFQDPFASLDPRMTVAQILAEPLSVQGMGNKSEQEAKVKELLSLVGLKPSQMNRYPHEFSGGQRQRISIARSIALQPELVIADEPVSALDVSIQAQVLNLLKDLQEQLSLTYLFISHDLAVIEHMCDVIAVMYLGKIVEMAPREELFADPKHPYTQALIKAIPKVGEGKKKMTKALSGEVPSPINPPSGCAFHPRCEVRLDKCDKAIPQLAGLRKGRDHEVSCWLYEQEQTSENS